MKIDQTEIVDTYAEAFRMIYSRLEVTAADEHWLNAGLNCLCGYGTSVIACDAEVGIERYLPAEETFDGRAGATVLVFAFSTDRLKETVPKRVGQCLMTCPTVAVFNASTGPGTGEIPLGNHLRYFGDGHQISKVIGDRRIWRIPVMDGEFIIEDRCYGQKGIAGGNFLIQSVNQSVGLAAARRAVDAIQRLPDIITPFPGGVVRSGSKVGSKYPNLRASTNDLFCPTLRSQVKSEIHAQANCVYEIVIDGTSEGAISSAMREGIRAAIGPGIPAISAGNYGGKLGKFLFPLHQVMGEP